LPARVANLSGRQLDLATFFVKSFCPPGGVVLDPMCGSSTTGHAALLASRRYIGIDVRQDKIDLSRRRLAELAQTTRLPPSAAPSVEGGSIR
jgi:site-specific DNA-methyltransferase (adenine-specific)